MCIIKNLLQYYINKILKIDPLKPKITKLMYIGKATFHISGTTIDSGLAIPLNKSYNELKTLNDEKDDTLMKNYY
jgi:uncharacterized radical SAM superfamily protein